MHEQPRESIMRVNQIGLARADVSPKLQRGPRVSSYPASSNDEELARHSQTLNGFDLLSHERADRVTFATTGD